MKPLSKALPGSEGTLDRGKAPPAQPRGSHRAKNGVLEPPRIGPATWCGRKEEDPHPIVYQGCHETDARTLLQGGINSYCLSYYNADTGGERTLIKHPGFHDPRCRTFLDSGAFSFLVFGYQGRMSEADVEKKVEPYIQRYSEWVLRYGEDRFDFHITFDYRVSASITWKMTKRLRELGLHPTPVYHGDSSISWLLRYIDAGYPLICLSKRFFLNDRQGLQRFYDQVFNICEKREVALHGLACTGREAWTLPWYSVDSTSLVKDAGMGVLSYWNSKGLQHKVPVSRESRGTVGEELLSYIKDCDLTLKELAEERTKRVLFNAIMLKRFLDSRKAKVWNKKTLF